MLFADDTILINVIRKGVNEMLEVWKQTLVSKNFRLSMTKTENLKCKFNDMAHDAEVEGEIDPQAILRRSSKCFESII